jgi:hypothetical protein
MKRVRSSLLPKRTGDIRKDMSESQLASLGAVSLAYNEAEVQIDLIMALALGLWAESAPHVTSRINGIDGKIEIIKVALRELGAPKEAQALLCETFGDAGFKELKKYRDGVIHARTLDAPSGIAGTAINRGKFYEVLLSKVALDGLYDRLVLIRLELIEACNIAMALAMVRTFTKLNMQFGLVAPQFLPLFDQTRAAHESNIQAATSRFRENHTRRLSLPPLPEFPSESELQQAHLQWIADQQAARTGWHLSFPEPVSAPHLRADDRPLVKKD